YSTHQTYFPLLEHSCRNAQVVLASTVVTGRNSFVLKGLLAARRCQRLRSTKVSIRSRSFACSRLVSTERPHRDLPVRRSAGVATIRSSNKTAGPRVQPQSECLLRATRQR